MAHQHGVNTEVAKEREQESEGRERERERQKWEREKSWLGKLFNLFVYFSMRRFALRCVALALFLLLRCIRWVTGRNDGGQIKWLTCLNMSIWITIQFDWQRATSIGFDCCFFLARLSGLVWFRLLCPCSLQYKKWIYLQSHQITNA